MGRLAGVGRQCAPVVPSRILANSHLPCDRRTGGSDAPGRSPRPWSLPDSAAARESWKFRAARPSLLLALTPRTGSVSASQLFA